MCAVVNINNITCPAKRPQQAGTASILNTADPTTVPTPISPFVMNVPTQLMNNSGLDVAAYGLQQLLNITQTMMRLSYINILTAIKVAPTTSSFIFKAERYTLN